MPRRLALRLVIFGGEALNVQALKPWFDVHGDRHPQLVNMYGITETTVHVTCYPLSCADLERPAAYTSQLNERAACSPIGRPIADLCVYVLDSCGSPSPLGVPGELYVGGAGLRAWLSEPPGTDRGEIRRQSILGHPRPHLYRTGDRVRYRSDGNLEFLGRLDDQVKIRGFRVELGEIESCLRRHPAIRDAVVLAREDSPGQKRLVAYLVAKGEELPTAADLRGHLEQELPEFMVPSAFVTLKALPLTPNGKVDRRALPLPGSGRPDLEHGYTAPRTPLEERLAGMWAEVLGLEQVGINNTFVEIGGNSLLATQVVSRIRSAFQAELPLRVFFEETTVAQLAEYVEAEIARCSWQSAAGTASAAPPIAVVPRTGELPLSFAQQRLWFIDQLEPNSSFYNLPLALRLTGPLDVAALERCLGEVLRRHEVFARRTGLAARAVQRMGAAEPFTLPLMDLSGLPQTEREGEVRRLLSEEAQRPFDLSQDLMLRAGLLRLREQEYVCWMTFHHVAADGWSVGILFRELTALYAAFGPPGGAPSTLGPGYPVCPGGGQPSPLTDLPIQYADFAVWQRKWLQGDVLEEQLGYWKQRLAGAAGAGIAHRPPAPCAANASRRTGTVRPGREHHEVSPGTKPARGYDTLS